MKCSIKYVSKEDVKCIQSGVDQDFLSVNCKAYIVAQQGKFDIGRYPYPNLCRSQQLQFKELVQHYRREEEVDYTAWDEIELYRWQKLVIKKLLAQNERQVIWISDEVGNHGKTTLAKYLGDFHGAQIKHNAQTKDLAHAYDGSPIIVMDYTRDKQDFINYSFLEGLKNGVLFSPKYESHTKDLQV